MRAARVVEPGSLRLVEAPVPVPGRDEVVVAVDACGVCGTDLHIIAGEWPADFKPIVPGHEFAGTISAIGPSVMEFEVGDQVAVQPNIYCGRCRFCRKARENLCERWRATGGTEDGGFAEFVLAPAAQVYHVPEGMPLPWAAMAEPVSCALHGLDRLRPRFGESYLIVGAGTMGLILGQVLRNAGAQTLVFADVEPSRLERARGFGFDAVAEDVSEATRYAPSGFEYVIDASGVTAAVEVAMGAVAKGGTLLIFGVTPRSERALYSPFRVFDEEITILGSMSVLHSFGRALEAIQSGVVDAEAMISDIFPLESIDDAIDQVRDRSGLKVQVRPGA